MKGTEGFSTMQQGFNSNVTFPEIQAEKNVLSGLSIKMGVVLGQSWLVQPQGELGWLKMVHSQEA